MPAKTRFFTAQPPLGVYTSAPSPMHAGGRSFWNENGDGQLAVRYPGCLLLANYTLPAQLACSHTCTTFCTLTMLLSPANTIGLDRRMQYANWAGVSQDGFWNSTVVSQQTRLHP